MKKSDAQGGTRSRSNAAGAHRPRHATPRKPSSSPSGRAESARVGAKDRRNVAKQRSDDVATIVRAFKARKKPAATATSRDVSLVPLSVGVRRAGVPLRKLLNELRIHDLIRSGRPTGVYVNEAELRAFLEPLRKEVKHGA